ncbi:MAG: hypothetical protein PHS14_07065 [Elusimicrobia bacterium]|nr:hypothetical protein [Elusimicrobiota bacterium]
MNRALLLLLLALPAAAAPIDSPKANQAPAKIDYETFARLHARLMDGDSAKRLEDALPRLSRNLKIAADVSGTYWTDCTIFDELAKAEILPEKAMKGLGIRREAAGGVVHAPAGVMHTYGYLFSQLQTAYGLKGKRWIESRLDERLGLPAGTFSPLTAEGEFASNLTSALFQLIGAPAKVAHAAKLKPAAKAIGRVEQRVTWKAPDGKTVKAAVFTHLVPLAPLTGLTTSDDYLLIYEMLRDGRHRVTTAFPVGQGFADAIMGTKPDKEPVFKPRFNLYVPPAWTVTAQENLGWRAGERP